MKQEQAIPEDKIIERVTHYLGRVEDLVLTLVAVVLILMALALLASTLFILFNALTNGTVRSLAVEILDSALLVMITMEIFYTVTLSLKWHTLVAEPFLIVGAIAAVRRVLVITATTVKPDVNPESVMWVMVELALLALIILAIATAVYILRKGQQYPAENT